MQINEEMIGTAIVSIVGTLLFAYVAFRLTLESRMKNLEHEVELLKPIKNILLQIGSEQVEKVFRGEEK